MAGRLFVVGTPIGNLEDLSPRAARVLGAVSVVAAEDTRSAQRLLSHLGLHVKAVSYFEGNEASRSAELCARLAAGEDVALISEAGMPGVSDPGERLVRTAAEAGLPIEVIPGPSAAIAALCGSGLPAARFTFIGFLPRVEGKRREELGLLRRNKETLIFYESPARLGDMLRDLAATLGPERRACVARELTKVYEEFVRGTLGALSARYATEPARGEITVVVAGASEEESAVSIDLEAEVDARIAAGNSAKDIAAALALLTGKPKRQIYQLALARAGQRRREPG
ncbi:MAG: 16S rRNA (cytidine(1402)-2'-O)-methyltransferase [Myxococcales bacterium]|nr:16S rRNA (cytidine(1402)-2'-O)-methyltransferase [Myxococcales bacterium]